MNLFITIRIWKFNINVSFNANRESKYPKLLTIKFYIQLWKQKS